MPASDFRVQHFEKVVEAADQTTIIEIPFIIDASRTRLMMGSPGLSMQPIGYEQTSDTLNSRDVQCGVEITGNDEITVTSSPNKQWPCVVTFSILSYVGVPFGVNDFVVERGSMRVPIGVGGLNIISQTSLTLGVTGTEKKQILLTGSHQDNVTTPDTAGEFDADLRFQGIFSYETSKANPLLFWVRRGHYSSAHVIVSWEIIDWLGSNWTLGDEPFGGGPPTTSDSLDAFTIAGGAGRTQGIDDVGSWGSTFIETNRAVSLASTPVPGESISHVYPGDTNTRLVMWTPVGSDTAATGDNAGTYHQISNPEVKVLRQGLTMGAGNSRIADVTDMAKSFFIPLVDPDGFITAKPDRVAVIFSGSPNGAAFGHAVGSMQYVGGVDGIQFRRANGGADWTEHIQVIQFGVEDDELSGDLSGTIVDVPKIDVAFQA